MDESTVVVSPSAPAVPAAAPAPVVAPVAATPPAHESADQIETRLRDEKGRFAPSKIREAAGLTPDEAVTTLAAPAVTTAAPEVSPSAPAVSTSLDDDLKAIEAVPIDAPSVAATPQVQQPTPTVPSTPEVAQVQAWQANPALAQQAVAAVYQWNRVDQALNKGDIGTFMSILSPQARQLVTEHLYRENKTAFAQRFADEANGVQSDPRLDTALQQLAEMRQQTERDRQAAIQQQQTQLQQQNMTQTAQKLQNTIDSLFTAVKITKDTPARRFLEGDLSQRLQADPAALAALRSGQFGHVRAAFQGVWKDWKSLNASPVIAGTPATPAPAPSAQLMSAPQGTPSVQAPASVDIVKQGKLTPEWWKGQLKRLVS